MGEEYVVARPAVSDTRSDLADLATEFLMCLRELSAQGDRAVAAVGSHGWRPFRFHTSMPDGVVTGTRCCRYPIM